MGLLRVFLLGSFRLVHDDWSSEVQVTHSAQSLLAYLILQRHRTHAREKLAGLFWGEDDQDRARSCLRSALCRLRRLLEVKGIPRGTYLLTTSAGEIGFDQESDYWLDVAVLEDRANRVLAQPVHVIEAADVQELEGALRLYTGELLEGFYDDWVLRERARLHRIYLNSLAHMMRYYRLCGDYDQSLSCGHRILASDPLREGVHREMMRLYVEVGQRALAVKQYENCREILASELSIEPMEETQALYDWIVLEAGLSRAKYTGCEESVCAQQALQQISLAMQGLEKIQEQIRQAIRLIERAKVS